MNFENLIENFNADQFSAVIGLLVGLLFGIFAQQSQFCLRAACIEFWRKNIGPKFAIWLLAFSGALIMTQLSIENGMIDTGDIRQLNSIGSMSGAIIGGLLFGSGMILARGCASRLLVLSATGNMRALISGLVVTLVAQASLRGVLSPMREELSSLWLLEAHERGFSHFLPSYGGLLIGVALLALGLFYTVKFSLNRKIAWMAFFTGCCITLGWVLTSWQANNSFDIVEEIDI